MTPRLSVIVPAYNSAATIGACLGAIRADMPADAELIVVDDASVDASAAIAERFANAVVRKVRNEGDGAARRSGMDAAKGAMFLFIDSDIVIPPGTCGRILEAFDHHPGVAAVTGRLSAERRPGFFTDYKNLYMNYIFGRQPDRVTFTYGSVVATRAEVARSSQAWKVRVVGDTAFGQELAGRGFEVRLLKDVEVVHLKRYTLSSFLRNDFMIPFQWAGIYARYRGWSQLGRRGTGFAHSSKAQLLSLAAAWTAALLALTALLGYCSGIVIAPAAAIWLGLNLRFLAFIFASRGAWYGIRSVPVTFVDHLVMAAGAGLGLILAYTRKQ